MLRKEQNFLVANATIKLFRLSAKENRYMNKFLVITVFIFLAGCKKENATAVFIRIQNTSVTKFSNINVASVDFGEISSSTTTDYRLITQPVYAAVCAVSIQDSTFSIGNGVCGTPLPPAFANGRYTFIIKPSASYPGYYDVEVKLE